MIRNAAWSSAAVLVCALAVAGVLRGAWLTADPPTAGNVGIVWHDEGAWVHNARNRALWGVWRTDAWNPVFVAPVFTALEFEAFRAFGVGTWQARLVPVASGLAAVALLFAGLGAAAGRRAAMIGASLLSTNYVFVMWNRAALMESTMTALIVASWAAYAWAPRVRAAGLASGACAVLAWLTKASAAFFVAALTLDVLATLALRWGNSNRPGQPIAAPDTDQARGAAWTLGGLALSAALAVALFIAPHWADYRFYNWQMSVLRKPDYTIHALLVRASWLPIVHDLFTRMWLTLTLAAFALPVVVARWRTARPAERLLVGWVLLGLLELVVHDSGNERRYVMFVPALVGLAALLLASRRPLGEGLAPLTARARWVALPLCLVLAYLVFGSLLRTLVQGVGPAARLSGALAVLAGVLLVWRWQRISSWIVVQRLSTSAAVLLMGFAVAGDLVQYSRWATARTYHNYDASRLVGELLPAGTLVHGKLANGLSLENKIRPVFVGRGFGNYADRATRDDVRYVLTYISPRIGYEGSVITDVLDAYPERRIVTTFSVSETGPWDRAALIDKFAGREHRGSQQMGARARH